MWVRDLVEVSNARENDRSGGVTGSRSPRGHLARAQRLFFLPDPGTGPGLRAVQVCSAGLAGGATLELLSLELEGALGGIQCLAQHWGGWGVSKARRQEVALLKFTQPWGWSWNCGLPHPSLRPGFFSTLCPVWGEGETDLGGWPLSCPPAAFLTSLPTNLAPAPKTPVR